MKIGDFNKEGQIKFGGGVLGSFVVKHFTTVTKILIQMPNMIKHDIKVFTFFITDATDK